MDDAPEAVGDRVRRYRRLRGLTQEQLADLANVDRRYLGRIETGEVLEPGAETMKKLAKALGVRIRALAEPLGWYDDEPAGPRDWLTDMLGDPTLADDGKGIIEKLAVRYREPSSEK